MNSLRSLGTNRVTVQVIEKRAHTHFKNESSVGKRTPTSQREGVYITYSTDPTDRWCTAHYVLAVRQSDSTDRHRLDRKWPLTSAGLRLLVAPGVRHVRLLELIISAGSLISLLSPMYYRLDLIMQSINLRNPLFPTQAFKRRSLASHAEPPAPRQRRGPLSG